MCTKLKTFPRNLVSHRYKERYYLPDGNTVLRKVCTTIIIYTVYTCFILMIQ